MDFVAFDLETTGFVPGVDKIVEIGAVRIKNKKVDAVFSTLINPEQPIPKASIKVHKITNEMVQSSPKINQILLKFTEFCNNYVMVAHNSQFDFQFLKASYEKEQIPTPNSPIVDTLQMARKAFPGLPNYKLPTLIEFLKIQSKTFHRAQDDALYCAKLFVNCTKRIFKDQEFDVESIAKIMKKPVLKFPVIETTGHQYSFF